jgi:arsenate reductase
MRQHWRSAFVKGELLGEEAFAPAACGKEMPDACRRRVLFLCTGNSARSQMAEAFLRTLGGDRFESCSAGLHATGIHPLTERVMAERGIDIGGQRSKDLSEYLGRVNFGMLITVCDRATEECPIFPGVATRLHWPLDDPVAVGGSDEERLEAFRRIRDEIERHVRELLASEQADYVAAGVRPASWVGAAQARWSEDAKRVG